MLPICRFFASSAEHVAGHPRELQRLHDRDDFEPLPAAEARQLLASQVGRESCQELRVVLEASLGELPPWLDHEALIARLEGAVGESCCARTSDPAGPLMVLRQRDRGAPKAEAKQGFHGASVREEAPAVDEPEPRRPEERLRTWFEVRVVDEIGEPVADIELDFVAGSASGTRRTDAAGVARADDADRSWGSVRLSSIEAATRVLEPRWQKPRSGEAPRGEDVVVHDLAPPERALTLRSETPLTVVLVPPPVEAEVRSVTFAENHALMKVNTSDWTQAGPDHPRPEWQQGGGASRAVSYTRGRPVRLDLELSATRRTGPTVEAELEGRASFAELTLKGRGTLGARAEKIAMTASGPLPDRVALLKGDIQFRATPEGGASRAIGTSKGHRLFVTLDTPISVSGSREEGITEKRMEAATLMVAGARSNDPHTIVGHVMGKFRSYTLRPNPSVPAEYSHPTYFNERGGAWPMAEYAQYAAECQAIVRFVRATIKQIGCPGTADLVVCWADPDVAGGAKGLEATVPPGGGLHGKVKQVGGRTWYACLVDRYPEEGRVYDIEEHNAHYMGLNNFEACLRFEHGGKKRYYGGGAGTYSSPDEVLLAFQALCWVSFGHTAPTGNDGARIEKVVKRWRRSDGSLL